MTIVYIRASSIYDDSRATKEISALAENNSITVLAWDRNGDSEYQCNHIFSQFPDIKLIFFKRAIENGAGINKTLQLVNWNSWIKQQLKKIAKVDVIHACNLDSAIAASHYCKKFNCKMVYDIYDYYIDSHSIPGFAKKMIEDKEISVINQSNCTIICTEERREQIKKANPKKVVVIHNSPDIDTPIEQKEIYDYSYCGTMNGSRLIGEILEEYCHNHSYTMAFAGNGYNARIAEQYDQEYDQFHYFGKIPYRKVLEIESKSKVISAIYSPDKRNHRLCAPNKFYEALALGKPVIVCRGTGIDKVVEENELGVVIDYSAKQFYRALDDLLNNDELRVRMGINGRRLYETNYKWALMRNRLLGTYDDLE